MIKYGLIDGSGKMIVPFNYDWIASYSEGFAMMKLDEKYGFLDKEGKEVIPCKYDWADSFSEGLAVVGMEFPEFP